MVVVGVALVVGLAWAVGWGARPLLVEDEAVREAWRAAGRTEAIVSISRGEDGGVALLQLHDEGHGLIQILGDKTVVGRVSAKDLHEVRARDGCLVMRFRDPGRAKLVFALPDAEAWAARLSSKRG